MGPRPAWPTAQARVAPPPRRHWYDGGVLIPALIGLVSLTVAGVTWRSLQLDENATDADRAALVDTAAVRLAELDASVLSSLFAGVDVKLQVLAAEARDLRAGLSAGEPSAADIARAEALDAEAEQLAILGNRVLDDTGLATPFDRRAAAEAILAGNRDFGRHNPEAALERADELRTRSLQLAGLAAVLAAAVLLLTAAQVSTRKANRLGFVSVAVVVWLASLVATAVVGVS